MNTIHHSTFLYNQVKKLNLCNSYSNRIINHFMSILISISFRIPWKNHKLCKKQFLSQNYNCTFPQFWKMGWLLTFRLLKTFRYWDYLFRSSTQQKTCFLHWRRYDSFQDKAFVTGFVSDWRCVFSSIPFKRKTRLWASGSCDSSFL